MYYILIKWQFAGYPCFFRDPMGFRHDQLVHGRQESTHVTDHSDVETLESCSSRPLSPCQTCTAEMEGETGSAPTHPLSLIFSTVFGTIRKRKNS